MDLTTRYLGLELKNPCMPGASPLVADLDTVRRLEDAGAAAIVLYSLFEEQIVQEQVASARARHTEQSFAEALSYLPDPEDFRLGPDEYLALIGKVKDAVSVPVIASLNGSSPSGWVRYAKQIEQAGADALELNTYELAHSLNDSSEQIEQHTVDLVTEMRAATRIPFAVKLLPVYAGLPAFASRLADAGAHGLVLFNRMYHPSIDLEELEMHAVHPLSHPGELSVRLRWLGMISPRVALSLACSGGVHSAEGALRALMCGADVVQVVSALLRHGPDYLGIIIQGIESWLEEKQYNSLSELRGSMSLLRCPDPRAYTRVNYIQTLRAWD